MDYYQTGDYLYFKTTDKPTGLKEIKGGVIVKSPTTGHAHKVVGGKLMKASDGTMYVMAGKRTVLKHEEHNDLALPAGVYTIKQVMEYDHLLEESRAVID